MSVSLQIMENVCKSRKILLQLLQKRGYDTTPQDNFSDNEIRVLLGEKQLDFDLESKDEENKKVFVKYLINTKIRNTSLRSYINDFIDSQEDLEPKNTDIIVILKDKPNESLLKVVDDFYSENQIYINLIYIKTILFNILEHDYVPEHTKISEHDYKILKQNLNINSKSQLPLISRHDAVSTILGIRPGEVVKIVRSSKNAGQYLSYRCCK